MPWLNEGAKGYKESLALYRRIIELSLPPGWIHYGQLLRATASVVANIAEEIGRFYGRPSDDAVRFSTFARGSLHEVGAFLDIAVIDGLVSDEQADSLKQECIELSEMLFMFIRKQKEH
jgi:four helix bundle protein